MRDLGFEPTGLRGQRWALHLAALGFLGRHVMGAGDWGFQASGLMIKVGAAGGLGMRAAAIVTEGVEWKHGGGGRERPAWANPALPSSPHCHPHILSGLTAHLAHRRALGSEIIPRPGGSQCPAGRLWPNAA